MILTLTPTSLLDIDLPAATGTAGSETIRLQLLPFFQGSPGAGGLLAANNLSDVASAASARSNLGLAIGSDVQAYSSVLASTTASFTSTLESQIGSVAATVSTLSTQVEEDVILQWAAGHLEPTCWWPDPSGEPEIYYSVSDFAQYSTEQPGTGNVWIKAGLDGGTF